MSFFATKVDLGTKTEVTTKSAKKIENLFLKKQLLIKYFWRLHNKNTYKTHNNHSKPTLLKISF
jgi:hypothetical protein